MIIDDLHTAIETQLAAMLPDIDVRFYPQLDDGERVSLPMLALELSGFDDDAPPGNSQLALLARFEARLVMDPNEADCDRLLPAMAAAIAARIHFQTWDQPVGPAKIGDIGPDGFKAALEGYSVWMIAWTHEIHVGEADDITVPAVVPREVSWNVNGDQVPAP